MHRIDTGLEKFMDVVVIKGVAKLRKFKI